MLEDEYSDDAENGPDGRLQILKPSAGVGVCSFPAGLIDLHGIEVRLMAGYGAVQPIQPLHYSS